MKTLHADIRAETQKVQSASPWIWCYKGVLEQTLAEREGVLVEVSRLDGSDRYGLA